MCVLNVKFSRSIAFVCVFVNDKNTFASLSTLCFIWHKQKPDFNVFFPSSLGCSLQRLSFYSDYNSLVRNVPYYWIATDFCCLQDGNEKEAWFKHTGKKDQFCACIRVFTHLSLIEFTGDNLPIAHIRPFLCVSARGIFFGLMHKIHTDKFWVFGFVRWAFDSLSIDLIELSIVNISHYFQLWLRKRFSSQLNLCGTNTN